jgi:hypothetical protein
VRAEVLGELEERPHLAHAKLEEFYSPYLEICVGISIEGKGIGLRLDTDAINHDELQRAC